MNVAFEFHRETIYFLPVLAASAQRCDNPLCDALHYQIVFGWLFFSVSFLVND